MDEVREMILHVHDEPELAVSRRLHVNAVNLPSIVHAVEDGRPEGRYVRKLWASEPP